MTKINLMTEISNCPRSVMEHVSLMVHVGDFFWIVQNGSGTGWPATGTSIRSKLCVGLIVLVGLVVHMLAYFRNQRIGEECTKLSQLNRLVVTGMQITMKENGDMYNNIGRCRGTRRSPFWSHGVCQSYGTRWRFPLVWTNAFEFATFAIIYHQNSHLATP